MAAKQYRLNWRDLLSTRRVRSLFGGPKSRITTGDLRTEFERDYGRTVYSTPFRRLRDKAQVFPLEPNDSVRTRLLHSLEVSSVAEDLAAQCVRDVVRKRENILGDDDLRAIPLVAATCGLVHDIGNPPFGHAGELAISSWFNERFNADETFRSSLGGEKSQMVQDFFSFEGNAQGIRTVSNMFLLADSYGLNFTAGTLSAACKYIAPSDQVDKTKHERSKPGFFASEDDIVRKVRELTGTADCRHPIAYLVEAADDIVYCSVDLEDGIIPPARLVALRDRPLYRTRTSVLSTGSQSADPWASLADSTQQAAVALQHRCVLNALNALPTICSTTRNGCTESCQSRAERRAIMAAPEGAPGRAAG
jgi:dGTPase